MDRRAESPALTPLLAELRTGHPGPADQVFPLVYDELRMMAAAAMRREQAGHTLQPTALVHETYLKLFGGHPVTARDRAHFFQIAARAMRQVLVDHARRRRTAKRGGGLLLPLKTELLADESAQPSLDIVALDIALERLAAIDERQARIVDLRFFADLDIQATADALGISRATVKRDWEVAKAWLRRELRAIDADDITASEGMHGNDPAASTSGDDTHAAEGFGSTTRS